MDRRTFAGLAALAPFLTSMVSTAAAATSNVLLVRPEDGHRYDIGGGEAHILAGSAQTGDAWWLGELRSDPGRRTSIHVHHNADEQFYVLEGTLSAWLDGAWLNLGPGSLAVIRRKTPHALGNRTQVPVRFLASGNPAGFERFFADLELLVRRLPYGSSEFLAELKKIYTHYDSELIGPPPQP